METDVSRLSQRIDAEFDLSRDRVRSLRRKHLQEQRGRQERLALFEQACGKLQDIWGPRLDTVKQRLGERLKVALLVQTGRPRAEIGFTSSIARIKLTFEAMTDRDVRALVLDYSLQTIPALISFPSKDRLEQPFEKIDPRATGDWIDDRIIDFVKTYLSLYEQDYFLGGPLVEDPVSRVRFPKCAAVSTLDCHGKTLYFMANETREEFEAKATPRALGH